MLQPGAVAKFAIKPVQLLGRIGEIDRTKTSKLLDRLKSSITLNHREKDLAGRVMYRPAEGHDRSADVESSDVIDNREHIRACRVRSGLLQRGDDEASGKIPLQRYKLRLHMRIQCLCCSLVVGDDLHRRIPREGNDLGDDDSLALGAEFLRQRIGADKGDIDE